MKAYRADLHIHSILSPCADLDMSPDRIVQFAIERGLDMIAVTDHNSTRQCAMVKKHAEGTNLLVINGCEVNSREEVHVLCLFEDDYSRDQFQHFLDNCLPEIPNRPDHDGHQLVVDHQNNITEEFPNHLTNPLTADLETIEKEVHRLNGILIPAHVDRPIASIYSQLGFLPTELKIDGLQISKHVAESEVRDHFDIPKEVTLIKASDAHYTEDIGSGVTSFYLYEKTFQELKWALNQKNGRQVIIET